MDGVEDVIPPFTDVVTEFKSFTLPVGRFALSEPTLDNEAGAVVVGCVFFNPVVPSTFVSSTTTDGRVVSGVGEIVSLISAVPGWTCCWLLTDDFSMSASRSIIRSPIPTSHSLSSYSKLESLLISLAVGVVVDVFGSVDA